MRGAAVGWSACTALAPGRIRAGLADAWTLELAGPAGLLAAAPGRATDPPAACATEGAKALARTAALASPAADGREYS